MDKEKVKETIIPSLQNVGQDVVPIISDLVRNNEHLTEENLRSQVDKLISSNIVDMEPNYVVRVHKLFELSYFNGCLSAHAEH